MVRGKCQATVQMTQRGQVQPQIRRLAETAAALRAGTSTYFAITRLTSIKSLCKQPERAAQFVCYRAESSAAAEHATNGRSCAELHRQASLGTSHTYYS